MRIHERGTSKEALVQLPFGECFKYNATPETSKKPRVWMKIKCKGAPVNAVDCKTGETILITPSDTAVTPIRAVIQIDEEIETD